jgi:hypothetical protein
MRKEQASRQHTAFTLVPGQMLSKREATVRAGWIPRCADNLASQDGSTGPSDRLDGGHALSHDVSAGKQSCSVIATPAPRRTCTMDPWSYKILTSSRFHKYL